MSGKSVDLGLQLVYGGTDWPSRRTFECSGPNGGYRAGPQTCESHAARPAFRNMSDLIGSGCVGNRVLCRDSAQHIPSGYAERQGFSYSAGLGPERCGRDGRPAAGFREVFTTVLAPTRTLTRENVGWIVRRAAVRAGMPAFGAHRLRHNAACVMIGAKVPLAGIAQALQHRSHIVTSGYARAGIDRLRPLARPWPGTPALPEGETS
jgi:hypothetical protein